MARIKAPQKADSRRLFLMVRAFFIAVPLTIVSAVFLAVTDYPVEEWPFVAGVFAASLLLSTTLVSWLLIFLGEKLNQYGRQVLAERGVDLDAAIAAHPVPKPPWVVLTVTLILLLIGTTWGLALNILVTILDHMGMPLFGPGLPFVAKIMFVVGSSGLARRLFTPVLTTLFNQTHGTPPDVSIRFCTLCI